MVSKSLILLSILALGIVLVPSINASPISIETSGGANGINNNSCPSGTSIQVTLGPTTTADLILVGVLSGGGSCPGIISLTDTLGQTYNQLISGTNPGNPGHVDPFRYYEYSSFANQPFASDIITMTAGGSCLLGLTAIAIKGVNQAAPFENTTPTVSNGNTTSPTTENATGTIVVNRPTSWVIGMVMQQFGRVADLNCGYTNNGGADVTSNCATLVSFAATPVLVEKCSPAASTTLLGATILGFFSSWTVLSIALQTDTGGGRSPNPGPTGFNSVPGPGGYRVPPQIADQGVLSFIGLIAGIILLSAIPTVKKQKKRKDSFI